MRRTATVGGLVTALVCAACSATVTGRPDTVAGATTAVVSVSAPSVATPSSDSGAPTDPDRTPIPTVLFGRPLTLSGGLVVTVAAGKAYTPSATAATDGSRHFMVFGFSVTSGSAPLDLSAFSATVLSGGVAGGGVFDSDNGIGAVPDTTLPAGRTTTFTLAFGVADPADVAMEVYAGTDPGLVVSKTPSTAARSPQPATTGTLTFGQTWRFADGLAVRASAPTAFTPSATAAVTRSAAYVGITVTVTNATGGPFPTSSMDLSLSSGDTAANPVADSDADVAPGPPDVIVPNGASLTFRIAFGVPRATRLTLLVTPTFDADPATFTSS